MNNKWWQFLRFLGLEFWLPLPLLGVAFWLAGGLWTEGVLQNSDRSVTAIEIMPDRAEPSSNILSINVRINRQSNTSQIRVKKATQVYQKQEFDLNTANLQQIEAQIAQRFDLSNEEITQLVRYQLSK